MSNQLRGVIKFGATLFLVGLFAAGCSSPEARKQKAYGRGLSYVKSGEPRKAISAVAEELSNVGKHDTAVALCSRCNELVPISPVILLRLARIYRQADDLESVEKDCQRLIELAPDASTPRKILASILAPRGQSEPALEQAWKAREIGPENPAILDTVGRIYPRLGDVGKALPILEAAKAGTGDNPEILYHLAEAYSAQDRHDDAGLHLESTLAAVRAFSGNSDARKLLDTVSGETDR